MSAKLRTGDPLYSYYPGFHVAAPPQFYRYTFREYSGFPGQGCAIGEHSGNNDPGCSTVGLHRSPLHAVEEEVRAAVAVAANALARVQSLLNHATTEEAREWPPAPTAG